MVTPLAGVKQQLLLSTCAVHALVNAVLSNSAIYCYFLSKFGI